MISDWKNIYEENKMIDNIYQEKYKGINDFYRKNAIELLVELGEFVNETKCFKYWTIKPVEKEKMLEELADCITMVMYFYHELDIEFSIEKIDNKIDLLHLINQTFYLGTKLIDKCDEKIVKEICSNLFNISEVLNIKEEEIIESIKNKHKIIKNRLNSNY